MIVAYKGLKQIKVAKYNSRTINKREAFKSAAEQCGIFAEKIIPLAKGLFDEKLVLLDKFEVSIKDETLSIKETSELLEKDFDAMQDSKYISDLANSLEVYAVYFITGVAADSIGYISTGKSYCEIAKKIIPAIQFEFEKGNYQNLLKIFVKWSSRIE